MHFPENDLTRFANYNPTSFDSNRNRVLWRDIKKIENWRVCPVIKTRDADCLSFANFVALERILEAIDPEGNDHEVHSFGHWACGWYELILVRPDSKCHREAWECRNALADYPVLSDDVHSEIEAEWHDEGRCDEYCRSCEAERENGDVECNSCGVRCYSYEGDTEPTCRRCA